MKENNPIGTEGEACGRKNLLTFVGVGCGGRTRTYCELAALEPERYRVIAAADPLPARVAQMCEVAGNPDLLCFPSDEALFAEGKIADVCIIGTQDSYHLAPALRAMEIGYDLLLEKPVATTAKEVVLLADTAARLGRKVFVCHVLRYTPFYETVWKVVRSGEIGEVISVDAREGVGHWHQAHSFVRGHWAVTGQSTPMIVAKSCHDTDVLSWILGKPCLRLTSYGSVSHFRPACAPVGAPARCLDGCPVAGECRYDARRYAGDQRGWLQWVMDGGKEATEAEVFQWLLDSPWGRCVYRCDNDAVDHQVVAMEFEGGATATFTMTAFDSHRKIVVCGSKGVLRGTMFDQGGQLEVERFCGGMRPIPLQPENGGYGGHGGGDAALVRSFFHEFSLPPEQMRTGIHSAVEGHLMGFAAEESRTTGRAIDLTEYKAQLRKEIAEEEQKRSA